MAEESSGQKAAGKDLGGKVRVGARWASLATVTAMGTQLLTTVALARLLTRDEFGIAAMAMLVVAVLTLFQDSGLHAALIQRQERIKIAVDSASVYAPLTGIALGALCLVSAPLVASFFGQDQVADLVRALAIVFFVRSFSIVPAALLQKELMFGRQSAVRISGSLIQMATAIALAFLGAGAWSIIVGQIALAFWSAVLMNVFTPMRPDPRNASVTEMRSLLRYGRHIVAGNSVGFLNSYSDAVLIGRLFGPASLGAYSIGFQTGRQAVANVTYISNQVVFPAYSKLQDDMPRFRSAYLRSLRFISTISMPVALMLAVLSNEVIRVVYGDKWEDAIPVLAIIAIQGLFLSVSATTGEVFKAKGRPDLFFQMGLIQVMMLFSLVIFLYPFGIAGFAGARAGAAFMIGLLSLTLASHVIEMPLMNWLGALRPSAVGATIMAAGLLGTKAAIGLVTDTATLPLLVLFLIEALVLYTVAMKLTAPEKWTEFMTELDRLSAFASLRRKVRDRFGFSGPPSASTG